MNIVIKKVTVVAAPVPPFVGTRIGIRLDDPASLTWGMQNIQLASGHEKAVIEWGDGSREEVTLNGAKTHAYARAGEYEVRISNDIAVLCCSSTVAGNVYRAVYAPCILSCRTNADALKTLYSGCFCGAVNMTAFSCEGANVQTLAGQVFGGCSSLVGRLDFPRAERLTASTFANDTGITELHFAGEFEAKIRAQSGFNTGFGAVNATVSFDL